MREDRGDPGESIIYVSLQDDLIKNSSVLQTLSNSRLWGDTNGISVSLIDKMIRNAQKQRESINFASRKHVVQYDDVVNVQRKTVYAQRNRILEGEDIHADILGMVDACAKSSACKSM